MLSISKQDAARSEIDTAIRTFFGEHALIPAFVLACAGGEIAGSVAAHRGRATLAQSLAHYIKSEQLGTVQRLVHAPYNFLKHADRDPDAELSNFDPRSVEFRLFFAVEDYAIAFGERTQLMLVLRVWFDCRYPQFLLEQPAHLETATRLLEFPAGKAAQDTLQPVRQLIALLDQHPNEFGSLSGAWAL